MLLSKSQLFQLQNRTEPHAAGRCKDILNGDTCVVAAGRQTSWFVNQVKVDAGFLRQLNVMDYSLLLAHQPLHQDEIDGKQSMANLVRRTMK